MRSTFTVECKPSLAAIRMMTTASYFQDSRVFRILAILTTVFVVSRNRAFAHAVRAFPVICHVTTLLSTAMLEPRSGVVKHEHQLLRRRTNSNRPALFAQRNVQRFVQLNRVLFTIDTDHQV
jgi:hypothetical protein